MEKENTVTPKVQTIRVYTKRSYDVHIGSGLFAYAGDVLYPFLKDKHTVIVTDSNVAPLYLDQLQSQLAEQECSSDCYIIEAGEQSKDPSVLFTLLEFLAEKGLGRNDCLIALGGGVVGDLTGFAAGIYQRGIDFVQIPTTLLSSVDSSVGGKTAVNLTAGKNLVGVFWQPRLVLIDPLMLQTLPQRELASGAAECVKTALLSDPHLLQSLTQSGFDSDWDDVIARCVSYKAEIVARDEQESDFRRLLNLGHTFGHAVETLSHYELTHGEAVSIGLQIIANASAKRGICDSEVPQAISRALQSFALPSQTDFSAQEIAHAALADKKRNGSHISLVLPYELGHCVISSTPIHELAQWVLDGMEASACK